MKTKRKFSLKLPGYEWFFYASDIDAAEEIVLSCLDFVDDDDQELSDEDIQNAKADEMLDSWKEAQ